MNIDNDTITKIKNFLIDKLSPIIIIIFGSTVSGNFRDDSDIDIAFLAEEEVEPYQLYKITQQLGTFLKKDVDLVNLKQVSTVFKAQIVGKGETIYFKNKYLEDSFKLKVLKEYALLNEERAPVLERIKKEARIYE